MFGYNETLGSRRKVSLCPLQVEHPKVSLQPDIPVLLGVVDDAPRHRLLVAEHAHVVVERRQVAVHHLGVVPHPNLASQIQKT